MSTLWSQSTVDQLLHLPLAIPSQESLQSLRQLIQDQVWNQGERSSPTYCQVHARAPQ